jgi:hypothetical protein
MKWTSRLAALFRKRKLDAELLFPLKIGSFVVCLKPPQ